MTEQAAWGNQARRGVSEGQLNDQTAGCMGQSSLREGGRGISEGRSNSQAAGCVE